MPQSLAAAASLDALLRQVSRSFYLSIRLLPKRLRGPVGLAYLLARATDTVADSETASADERLGLLAIIRAAIDGEQKVEHARLTAFAHLQSHEGERHLLMRTGECLALLAQTDPADRADIQTVLRHIVRGQSLDLSRAVLPDAAALHEYTYLVAGSVGEFWTDICTRHVPGFASRDIAEMRALGRSFGCALQLVNIVRDAGEDLRAGRCYFPRDELVQIGIQGDEAAADAGVGPTLHLAQAVLANRAAFAPVWQRWQETAAIRLADGMAYAQAVESRRIRAAVALPAILGRDTLQRLRIAGEQALDARVKVPRSEVRALLFRVALGFAGRPTLRREWDNRAR